MNENILKLFENSGKGDFPLEKEIGLAQGSLRNWKLGKSKPSTEALIKIANYFNVSVDYLLGTEKKGLENLKSLSPNLIQIQNALLDTKIDKLSEEQLQLLINVVNNFVDAVNKK